MADGDGELEKRVRLLEVSDAVNVGRLNELEGWRRHDEPRISKLVSDGMVADQVRVALAQHSARSWGLLTKIAAATAATVTVVGGLLAILQALGLHLG